MVAEKLTCRLHALQATVPASRCVIRETDIVSLTPSGWLGCNLHYCHSNKKSTDWMLSYGGLRGDELSVLIKSNAKLLGACAYPYADPNSLRIATDFMNVLFALDKITDDQNTVDTGATRDAFTNALSGKSRDDTSPKTTFTKNFLERLGHASEKLGARFVLHCIEFVDTTVRQAGLRASGKSPSYDEYVKIRCENAGVLPSFDLDEAAPFPKRYSGTAIS
ncbi:hypothetical protein ACEPAF_3103 [Sanghuangporus sanghuang]